MAFNPEGVSTDVVDFFKDNPKVSSALERASTYQDLNGVFTDFLTYHEIIVKYWDPRYCHEDKEYATKLDIKPREGIPALEIQKGTGFLTFTDCLTFAAQSFLAGQKGFGLSSKREVIETDIDIWLKRGHRVRLSKDEEGKIILEAQREWDHHPVLRVIGNNFVNCLLAFHSNILKEEVLKRAEDSKFMYKQDSNTPTTPIIVFS